MHKERVSQDIHALLDEAVRTFTSCYGGLYKCYKNYFHSYIENRLLELGEHYGLKSTKTIRQTGRRTRVQHHDVLYHKNQIPYVQIKVDSSFQDATWVKLQVNRTIPNKVWVVYGGKDYSHRYQAGTNVLVVYHPLTFKETIYHEEQLQLFE